MKKQILTAILFTIVSFGYSQTVIKSFKGPTTSTGDLAYDGHYLWMIGNDGFIYQLSTIDGSIKKSIPMTISSGNSYGLAFDGSNLWMSDPKVNEIQIIDTTDGTIIRTFSGPKTSPSNMTGITYDGTNIWINDYGVWSGDFSIYEGDSTYVLNKNGSVINSFPTPFQGPAGLGFSDGYIYSGDLYSEQIFILSKDNFAVIDSFPTIGGRFPNGITSDGDYLWFANNESDSIYKVDMSGVLTSNDQWKTNDDLEITIFPNPSKDVININVNNSLISSIELFDISGKMIHSSGNLKGNKNQPLDLSNYSSGIYFLKVYTNNGLQIKRFLKQ